MPPLADPPVYVVGDIHGHLDALVLLLRRAGLMSESLTWTGGESRLWFLGDFADRGANGLAAIDLAMWLQREASEAGGFVDALLGNHDLLLVAARRFGSGFLANWRRNGGVTGDLRGLHSRHAQWLISRPAMAREGDVLLIHADASFYSAYGGDAEEVNETVARAIAGGESTVWDVLLDQFSERHAFDETEPGGAGRAAAFLDHFGARQLVHGHTPISIVTGTPPAEVDRPYIYAGGRCVNVDGGFYLGGPGFVYRLDTEPAVNRR